MLPNNHSLFCVNVINLIFYAISIVFYAIFIVFYAISTIVIAPVSIFIAIFLSTFVDFLGSAGGFLGSAVSLQGSGGVFYARFVLFCLFFDVIVIQSEDCSFGVELLVDFRRRPAVLSPQGEELEKARAEFFTDFDKCEECEEDIVAGIAGSARDCDVFWQA